MITALEKRLQQIFLRLLPRRWSVALGSRAGFDGVFRSILHLVVEKGLRLSVGVFTYALVVRHLGPTEYGRYSWFLNYVTIFHPLILYGLDEIVSRDLVRAKNDPVRTGTIIGTTLGVKGANALFGSALMMAGIVFLRPQDGQLILFTVGYTIAYSLKSLEAWDIFFQSRLDVRRLTWSRNGAYLLNAGFRLLAIHFRRGTLFFLFLSGVEYALGRVFMLGSYWREIRSVHLRWDRSYARKLWREAFPQFITLFCMVFNDRVAVLMVGAFYGDLGSGTYYTAMGLMEIWLFFPTAVTASVFPAIVKAHADDAALYRVRVQTLADVMVWSAAALALVLTLWGGDMIVFLFGKRFIPSIAILKVSAWVQIFVYYNWVRLKWFTLEHALPILMGMSLTALILQGALALWLLPRLGVVGASWSALGGHAGAMLLWAIFHPKSRESALIFGRALLRPFSLGQRRA